MQLKRLYHEMIAYATTLGYLFSCLMERLMSEKINDGHLEAWRLFITAHTEVITRIDEQLASADQIPLHWYDVLIELYEAPERKLRMHELAQKVVLSRSGLTRLVDRLEKANLLHREIDSDDRRGFYAVLTEAGVGAMRAAWPVYSGGITAYFARHVSEEEAALLAGIFTRMIDSARKSAQD